MPLSQVELEARRSELLAQFESYRAQVSEAMDGVVSALSEGRYAEACVMMSTISAHQGRASVDMRAILVKNGFMSREREDG